jgi:hypothetical protein
VARSISARYIFLHGAPDRWLCLLPILLLRELVFFFENWLYTATYMADARVQLLPLVTTGDPDFVEHDFYAIFSSLGVLNHDTQIAAVVRFGGWCGMLACIGWLASRYQKRPNLEQWIVRISL